MNNQTILIASIILCSLGGWYVVMSKYFALKKILQAETNAKQSRPHVAVAPQASSRRAVEAPIYMPDPFPETEYVPGEHIPGMGPPPLPNMPYRVPPEVVTALQQRQQEVINNTAIQQQLNSHTAMQQQRSESVTNVNNRKREVCNWGCMLHVSGMALITGIPFLNIIAPLLLWLWKKEQHPFLAKQGREVVNFQITYTFIQFLCLGLGTLFVWLSPAAATYLFELTRPVRVVFATSMYLPFNIFTVLPFFWACVMIVRGAVAAYHGISYRYPLSQPFIFEGSALQTKQQADQVIMRKEPQIQPQQQPETVGPNFNRINFG
jgi:uncharacterized Tic20 family protein